MRKLLSLALFCSFATLAGCAAPTSSPEVSQSGGASAPADVRGDAPASVSAGSRTAPRQSAARGSGQGLTRFGIAALHAGARAGVVVPGPSRTRAGGPVCNALPDPVATGDLVIAVGPVPAGVGGDVVDGTYVFTGGNYYGGGAGGVPGTVLATIGATVVLSAGNYDEISSFPGQQTETSSGTITFAGTTGSSTSSCPSVQSGAGDYTFDGATLTFYGPDSSESYALQ